MSNKSQRNGPRGARDGAQQAVLRTPEAAAYIDLSQSLLKKWRGKASGDPGERGPPFIRITSRLVVYRVSELDAWLDSHQGGVVAASHRNSEESVAA